MALMHQPGQRVPLPVRAFLLPALVCNLFCPLAAWGQSNGGDQAEVRGFRGEIDVTVLDNSGHLISVPADVKVLRDGAPYDQGVTSKGRVFFMVPALGEFSVSVDAAGYKSAQKDVSVVMETKYDVEFNLQPDTSPNFTPGAAGNPILAPKAKEALDKGMQALRDDKLDEAEKSLDQALKLAPNNPEVLYVLGVLDLKKREWTKAQSVLEKATQIEPNSARALAALGMALCNQQRYAEAIPPLEKSVQLNSVSDWETHWSLAESYYHSERFDEALKFSQQARAEANGQVLQVDLLVAKSLVAVGRYEDSAKVLRELIKNHSDGQEAVTARRFLERLTADGKIHPQ
jgi:Flp pilus assembly protein TadD